MNKDKRNNIQLLGTLNNADESGIIANANQIYDDVQQKAQETINSELIAAVGTGGSVDSRIASAVAAETSRAQEAEANRYTKNETYTKEELNNLITTPNQKYVSVTATDQTTAVTDVLPAIGLADTVYRVGNWDGSQYDVTKYSEYAWNSRDYVHLSTKTQIGDVFDISAYHATGGTLATYDNLEDALGTNGKNIPQSLRKGGMSVKFVQTSDNKYVQYKCKSQLFSTDPEDWAVDGVARYVENPEFLICWLDANKHILFGYQKNGNFLFGGGVPNQIVDYVNKKIADLSLDEYEDIVAFLGNLITSDRTLSQLLAAKVDKEENKSLIPTQYIQEVDNPEFLVVWLDSNNRIIFGAKKNDFYFGCGVPTQIQDAIRTAIDNCKADIQIIIDGVNSAIQEEIADINERCPQLIDNKEWLYVVVDSQKNILEGYRRDKAYVNYYISETYRDYVQNVVSTAIQALGLADILTSLQKRENESIMLGFDEDLERIDLEIIGKNIALGSVGIGNVVNLTPENVGGYGYVIVPCSSEDIFYISARGGNNPRAYGFIDENNVLLAMAPTQATYSMEKIIAPIGAAKLIINSNRATTSFKGNGQIVDRVDKLYNKHYDSIYTTPEDLMYAYINGLQFAKELNNPIADLTKSGDKMVHVSTFKIINGKIYATYYANRIGTGETPSEHLARFVICDLADPTDIQYYDVGFTVNSKQPDTPDDLWHIEGEEVDYLYDTILLTIDDNTLFILWTASAGGKYYRVYRTYNITTGVFSDVQLNYYKVGNDTEVFNSVNMATMYAANGIEHGEFASDIGLMQKLSSRVEDGVTYYYSGIYYYYHTAIVKTTDLITWEFVSSPDFVWPYAPIKWENAVYVKDDKVFYMQRVEDTHNYGILAIYDLETKTWGNPVKVPEAQSRYDFIEFNGNLYCAHSPKDRNHIAIMKIGDRPNRSYDVQVALISQYFYPFMQTYNGELYMSYTAGRRHIYLSKITIGSISADSINTVFKTMFNI